MNMDAFVQLRLHTLRANPHFQDTPGLEERVRESLEQNVELAKKNGNVESFESHGVLGGLLLWFCKENSFFGVPTSELMVDCNMQNAEAVNWMHNRIASFCNTQLAAEAHASMQPLPPQVCFLHPSTLDFLPVLLKGGFGIDSVLLRGVVSTAISKLHPKTNLAELLVPLDVTCDLLKSEDEIIQIGNLSRAFFTAHPEYCWFGGHDVVVKRDAAELRAALEGKQPTHFVLRRKNEVLGYFGFTTQVGSGSVGIHAGMTLLLHKSLQGKKLSRAIYWKLLQEMRLLHVAEFRGGTSQPAVLALGAEMGRTLQAVILRRGATTFSREHFAPYL